MPPHWTEKLIEKHACANAVKWAQQYPTALSAWNACERGDWLNWLCSHFPSPRNGKREFFQTALAIANSVSYLCTNIPKAQIAIEMAQAWLDNPTDTARAAAREAAWVEAVAARAARAAAMEAARVEAGETAVEAHRKLIANIVRHYLKCPI